jgi:hypothetical protein
MVLRPPFLGAMLFRAMFFVANLIAASFLRVPFFYSSLLAPLGTVLFNPPFLGAPLLPTPGAGARVGTPALVVFRAPRPRRVRRPGPPRRRRLIAPAVSVLTAASAVDPVPAIVNGSTVDEDETRRHVRHARA